MIKNNTRPTLFNAALSLRSFAVPFFRRQMTPVPLPGPLLVVISLKKGLKGLELFSP